MNETTALELILAAAVGIVAVLWILRRDRRQAQTSAGPDQPFAVSTEGEKRCPSCGMGNLWTDSRCISCGKPLPG